MLSSAHAPTMNPELPISLQGNKIANLSPHEPIAQHERRGRQRFWRGAALLTLALVLSASYLRYRRWHWCSTTSPKIANADLGLPKEVQRAWAAKSPYFPAAEYVPPPAHCEVVQVNLLQRHGTRYPTVKNAKKIKKVVRKLLSAGFYLEEEYQFLRDFEWDLGVDDLLPLGAKEAFESGIQQYLRYKHLIEDDQLPFVRASGSVRVVDSAANWTHGFSAASGHVYTPSISVVISEEQGSNNTLDDSMCPNAKGSKKAGKIWRDMFTPPIVDRINWAAPGAEIDNKDVIHLMPLCAFESLFHGTASPFCGLFTVEEWLAREYYDDLVKYYKTGHGNPLGPVQGVGYANELLARLTGQPVQDNTSTNRTLDASPLTFPLDRRFYADFSHDNQMVGIYSAIGLFRPDEAPAPGDLDPERTWRISRMTPFSGRMVTEKLDCQDGVEYVRILVNDAVQPLEFCGADEDGLCTLDDFVESQAYARSNGGGDWEMCFEDWY